MKIPHQTARIIIKSLESGVVPRQGLAYLAVNRKQEISSILYDLDLIGKGGSSFRFFIGRYGSGKSFLLQLLRSEAVIETEAGMAGIRKQFAWMMKKR